MQDISRAQLPIRHKGVSYVLVSQKLKAKDVELDMHSYWVECDRSTIVDNGTEIGTK